jgi:hypothetical protein
MAAPAAAALYGGGGRAATDCLTVFDANVTAPLDAPRRVVCVDGDGTCDTDGTVNGACAIPVAVCANSTFSSTCALSGVQSITVDHAVDNGEPKFDPNFQALQTRIDNEIAPPTTQSDLCTQPTTISVPIRGPFAAHRCSRGRKRVRLVTLTPVLGGEIYTDVDRLRLVCVPAPDLGCDPTVLFAGTFDRIQRQIFSQKCAVSGCHDSQSMAAGLLLESGSSLGNLVNVTPTNSAAASAGWKRVTALDAATGDAATSLLYQKVFGGLPEELGGRMPFGRARLHGALIEVIRLWIENGAPASGWVPGTD